MFINWKELKFKTKTKITTLLSERQQEFKKLFRQEA